MSVVFHCYELLLLRKVAQNIKLWHELKERALKGEHLYTAGEIPPDLWYLAITISETKDRFWDFVRREVTQEVLTYKRNGETLLSKYLNMYAFVELHLDSIFQYGEVAVLPRELFKCPNVRHLSLKYNYLETIPPDIGRLTKLEHLALTNNKLQNNSIPFTLTYCTRLNTLLLDNNLLDALPGFLLQIPSLQTVHRHGNHNYFKATFMWYHTDVNDRILFVENSTHQQCQIVPHSLQFLAAKTVIASKINFFECVEVAQMLKDYISDSYSNFNLCANCNTAKLHNEPGYKVFTFKNPYLGNTCVPFQHWACCMECAESIEIPARVEQIMASMEQDRQYDLYVKESQVRSNHRQRDGTDFNFGCIIL
uniref:Uncharacterized protein n=1 Tax=Strigamia maritima TaxID=126957 RepID=T1JGE5_STRMM